VERRESLRDLLRDIGTLPEDQRSALILTQLGTLKHEEVARVLGVPTAKVRALVFQARNSLISTRLARETACHDIREQLATLTGGGLRRGNLRRHLVSCSGCRDYQLALKRQRAAIVALLPVVAQPLLRQKILAEVAGGAGAGAGAAAGVGGVAGWLAANGVALKVGLAATLAATGVGAAVVTGGLHRAVGHSHPTPVVELAQARASTGSPAKPLAAAPRRQAARPRYQVIDLHKPKRSSSNKPKHRSSHLKVPSATRTEQTDRETTTAPSNTPASSPTSPGQAKQPGDSPRGQTRNDGTPPGLAKQGGTPPGLSKQGGTPPGQVKQNTLPPAATTPAPATPPGNANGQDNGNAGGNRNGPAGSNAGGNGDGHGSGNAGGNGNGH